MWDFSSKNTLRSTHAIHPYVASMNPHLARKLIEKLIPKTDGYLLDPFSGGGAVLVESLLTHTKAQGIDVNPLAVLISGAKTKYISRTELEGTMCWVLTEYRIRNNIDIIIPKESRIEYWFKPNSIHPLSKLHNIIEDIDDIDVKNFFRTIFSITVRDVSCTYRGEIRLRKLQDKDYEKFNPEVLTKFIERVKLAIERVSQLPSEHIVNVSSGNVTKMDFETDQFTTIVCSPPYGDDRNGVGYFQYSKNMLYWLGYTSEMIKSCKNNFLGEIKANKTLPESDYLSETLDRILSNPIPSNKNADQEFIAFYCDYQQALKEMARVCSDKIAIVIGNRTLSKTQIDNAMITTEFMENAGYSLSEYYKRVIDKKRIGVMKSGGSRNTSGGGLINIEHTLIYQKN